MTFRTATADGAAGAGGGGLGRHGLSRLHGSTLATAAASLHRWMIDAGSKRTTLVAAILGSAIVFLDGTVVNVALPAIREDLDTGLAAQQWIVEAYLLTLGSLVLVGGSLGDLLGRRRIFIAGLVGFGVTSALCAMAPTRRAADRGAGAAGHRRRAARAVEPRADHRDLPGDERGAAIGSWTAWTGMAIVIGPLGGGALVEFVVLALDLRDQRAARAGHAG